MKRFLTLCLLVLTINSVSAKQPIYPHMYAHRGCWAKDKNGEWVIPENSIEAVAVAKRMGYEGIECDVRYTKDHQMVILHDATLNRTARHAGNYSELERPIYLKDLTLEELRRDYVLASTNPELRTPIPTLKELLDECKRQGIKPMLHSDIWESYEMAQEMFGSDWICFTGGVEHMKKVRAFSDCTILLAINDGTAEENIARLQQIGGHCGISTMNYNLYTPQFCKALTDAGYEVQASIFPAPHEATAQHNGITYQLTDFSFMPPADEKQKHEHTCRMSRLGFILQIFNPKNRRFRKIGNNSDHYGMVIDISTRKKLSGDITVKLNNQEYHFVSNQKESLYIGKRVIYDQSQWNAEISCNSRNNKNIIKKYKVTIYDM